MTFSLSPAYLASICLCLLVLGITYLRIPIAFLLAIIGIGGYALLDGMPMALNMAGNELWGVFSSYGLTVIPLFVFMGQVCFHFGLSERLYNAVQAWFGHRRGGLALATLLACGGFAAICGSNTATAATMSVVALPEMRKYGYHPVLATGTVVAGTTLGAIIPPSVVAIVVGVQTGQSIEALFVGSLLPGLLLLGLFVATLPFVLRKHPSWAPTVKKAAWQERVQTLSAFFEGGFLFGIVLAGLIFGFFTPTEAGAVGSAMALCMAFYRRAMPLSRLYKALDESLRIACMMMLLLAGAAMFGKFITLTRLPFELATALAQLALPEPVVLGLVVIVFIIGGMVMDALALLVIALPIFFPLAEAMHWNPLWFSVSLIIVTSMGAMTPPVGVAAYVVANLSGKDDHERVSLGQVFTGAMLFLPAYVICLILVLVLPSIVTALPKML